jgi:hypothetical protein
MPTQTVRKRVCASCGEIWFTAEIIVPSFAVGWSAPQGHKPVLRVPLDVTLQHVEPADMVVVGKASHKLLKARRDLTATECDDALA